MLFRLICPFIYSIIVGSAWSICFKKNFTSSLASAFMMHVVLVMLSGLVFSRLSIGVYGGVGIAVTSLIFRGIKDRINVRKIKVYAGELWEGGLFIFLIFYCFCFFTNGNKRFINWDEFSHWGMFIKESLRLDMFYCKSPLDFSHKDYVPAITMFEVIWCRICGRFSESDAYRAIQIFMFSMLMPMFESISKYAVSEIKEKKNKTILMRNTFFQLGVVFLTLLIPLLFCSNDGFMFYHSIYCDMPMGIILFWCVFEAFKEAANWPYIIIIMTIGVTVLVMSKMTAMALMPLVIIILIVFMIFSGSFPKGKNCISFCPVVICPCGLWFWFNKYVDNFIPNKGGIQSYDGMKLSSLKEVFTSPQKSSIPYLGEVRKEFIDAIIFRDILINGSYIVVMVLIILLMCIIARLDRNPNRKIKTIAAGIWIFCSGVYYAFLMYFLYSTAFSEHEAVKLASYERYMNSFVIATVLLVIAVYFDSNLWITYHKVFNISMALLIGYIFIVHIYTFRQVVPGDISRDDDEVRGYTASASVIMESTQDNDRIFLVVRGDNRDFRNHERFYCNPRIIDGGSIGPAIDEEDGYSTDLSIEDFKDELGEYDYIYFCKIDDEFIKKYSMMFEEPSLIYEGSIYRISGIDTKVILEDVN